MIQTLSLLRHAKAEPWSPGDDDFEGSLSERGHKHMAHLSLWALKNLLVPGATLCSSSKRTRETLRPFFANWRGLELSTHYLDEIYEASTGMLYSVAESPFDSADSILMVGHNPGFEYLALGVLRDSDATGITKMATGTLAVIEFPNSYKQDCGQGVLRHWITRKNLSGN